ncbi:unnamed protein product [Rotaria sp. Silwood2]|nr:unnamed protein product [Rotaria sp. Silwood2]
MEASSLQSKNISTTQTTTLNLTTSSIRSSLPSQEKITKKKRKTSSKIVASDRRDINVRSQIGGHLCDIRYAGLVKLMGAMNLPSRIQDERYSKWDRDLLIIVKSFTGRSMKKAVEETVAAENGTELMISGDGFWQTRGKEIKKIEDLNHFSKRMKRGLETIKREHGRKKLSDGKTIGGKNRLSVHNILRLQMTFASTIRKFKHDLDLLFKGSWAIFWHEYSTNDDPRHDYCSIDWCGYLKSVHDKTPYDHTSHALPRPVLDAIKPVFNNLCSRESLTRVMDASTQNPNEGFYSLVWLMSPKHKASSGTTFEIACCLAIIIFNDGYFASGMIKQIISQAISNHN